jgi:SAM-dependent methyltransferase
MDINPHHFTEPGGKRAVGSFLRLPVQSNSIDYANLSLALHYTSFLPSKGNYERAELLQEMNRVLKVGGRGIINLMYTLDLKNPAGFQEAVEAMGFKIIAEQSGEVESDDHFRTHLVTVEKVEHRAETSGELIKRLSPSAIKGLKLTRKPTALRDSRKIVTRFVLNGTTTIHTQLNTADTASLREEQLVTRQMRMLQNRYHGVKNIPPLQIQAGGFARFFNGRAYVLFKRLQSASGAVVLR